jgi:hypothetical protein
MVMAHVNINLRSELGQMVYVQEPKIAWTPLGLLLQQNHEKKTKEKT